MKKLCMFIALIVILLAGCEKKDETRGITSNVTSDVTSGVTSDTSPSLAVTVSPDLPVDVPEVAASVSPDYEPAEMEWEFNSGEFAAELFTAVKENNAAVVDKHMSYAELTGFADGGQMQDSVRQKLEAEVFRRLSWSEPDAHSLNDGTGICEITCDITNVDMVDAVSQLLVDGNRLISENESLPEGERLSEEQINERLTGMLITSIKATDTFVTKTVSFKVERIDGEARVIGSTALIDAFTGGFEEALSQSGFAIYY